MLAWSCFPSQSHTPGRQGEPRTARRSFRERAEATSPARERRGPVYSIHRSAGIPAVSLAGGRCPAKRVLISTLRDGGNRSIPLDVTPPLALTEPAVEKVPRRMPSPSYNRFQRASHLLRYLSSCIMSLVIDDAASKARSKGSSGDEELHGAGQLAGTAPGGVGHRGSL